VTAKTEFKVTSVIRANPVQPVQPLSAEAYAIIALLGLIIGMGLLLFYVYRVPELIESGVQGQVFYFLLIPWALACAAFLFGAMRSYARFAHRQMANAVELGGPVVIFCLVIGGGFKLVPPPHETFDLTVRAHSADDRNPIINSGQIIIDLDNDRRSNPISPNGEADFKGIPAKFRGAFVGVLPQVDGYKQKLQRLKLRGAVLDVTLQRAPRPVTRLTGEIIPPPKYWASLRITLDGQPEEGTVNELGRFDFQVSGKDGDTIRLKIYDDTNLVYDEFQTLPGPLTLTLHNM